MIGAKKLCKYDEIVKIPSENLHPIPRAQSQSARRQERKIPSGELPSRQISLNQGLHKPRNIFFPFENNRSSRQISLNQVLHKPGYNFPFENQNSEYFTENLIWF